MKNKTKKNRNFKCHMMIIIIPFIDVWSNGIRNGKRILFNRIRECVCVYVGKIRKMDEIRMNQSNFYIYLFDE